MQQKSKTIFQMLEVSGIFFRAHLPVTPIPKSTGISEHWTEFRDMLVFLIHSNDTISDIEDQNK